MFQTEHDGEPVQQGEPFQEGELHEECGIFGISAANRDVARVTYFGLYALQHRGQEGAGIATSDGTAAYLHKGIGLVAQVFNEENLRPLHGHLAIGHTRYSTTGSSHLRNVQPYLIETIDGPLGLAHNGNLTNALTLRQQLLERGVGLSSTSDSEIIIQMMAAPSGVWSSGRATNRQQADTRWFDRIRAFMQVAEGAYSLAILTRDAVYGVRDPLGLRPLCLGKLEGGYVLASESCALQTVGATYLREVEPGEIVRIDQHGLIALPGIPSTQRALCSFEYVYFARPDSLLEGQVIHDVRQRLGRQLALESPVPADIVVGVPDSATPAAIGYSLESGLPYTEGFTKNRYIGRTFIQPDQQLRQMGVRLKFNPLTANLRGKRVVLIDDSIVRGTTSGQIIQLLREGGASEVHVRVSSPPVRHPCFMGVDMATYRELIAHRMEVEQICQQIGADSLAFLSLPGMLAAMGDTPESGTETHCTACFSGRYPITIPEWLFSENRITLFDQVWGN